MENEEKTEPESELKLEAGGTVIIGTNCPIHGQQNRMCFIQSAEAGRGIDAWELMCCMRCAAEVMNEAVARKQWEYCEAQRIKEEEQ